jgi:uncharacterized membrane protein (DUF106 family)
MDSDTLQRVKEMAKEVKVKRVGKTKNSPRRKTGTKPVKQIQKRKIQIYKGQLAKSKVKPSGKYTKQLV